MLPDVYSALHETSTHRIGLTLHFIPHLTLVMSANGKTVDDKSTPNSAAKLSFNIFLGQRTTAIMMISVHRPFPASCEVPLFTSCGPPTRECM